MIIIIVIIMTIVWRKKEEKAGLYGLVWLRSASHEPRATSHKAQSTKQHGSVLRIRTEVKEVQDRKEAGETIRRRYFRFPKMDIRDMIRRRGRRSRPRPSTTSDGGEAVAVDVHGSDARRESPATSPLV